jgi:membrane fusion protein (multidrug efflux system)
MKKRFLLAALILGAAVVAGVVWLQVRPAAAQKTAVPSGVTAAATGSTAGALSSPGAGVPDKAGPGAANASGKATASGGATGGSAAGDKPGAPPADFIELSDNDLLTVAPTSLVRTIPLTGTLKPVRQGLVRAKVAGELIDLKVREAMAVKQGDLIARIDPTDFQARVREREAVERSARAQLEQAQRTLENNRQLLAKNFISQNAFDNAQSGQQVAIANLDAATAQLAQARKALADTAVRAPMSGTVAERFVQPGEKVSPDTRILSIVDLSLMEIEALVPSSDIGAVRAGQRVSLRVEGIAADLQGTILRIAPATAQGTRSVPIYIGLENRESRLPAGLFAQGSLEVARRDAVIVVPDTAVRETSGRSFVYLIENDRLAERQVTLGMHNASARAPNGSIGAVEITSGLKAGDRIVAVNLGALRVGSPVRVSAR